MPWKTWEEQSQAWQPAQPAFRQLLQVVAPCARQVSKFPSCFQLLEKGLIPQQLLQLVLPNQGSPPPVLLLRCFQHPARLLDDLQRRLVEVQRATKKNQTN